MNGNLLPFDLVLLVPGLDEQETLQSLLNSRRESLGIRRINCEILRHPRRDPGCFKEAEKILQPYINRASYALVIFDHKGSGQEARSAVELAHEVRQRLSQSGWQDRANVLVIEPELEVWVWSDSPHVEEVLGWKERHLGLRRWLSERGLWPEGQIKPDRPKESLLAALVESRIRRSSSIYRELAEKVGLERCQDRAFGELREILREWFPSD